MAGSGLAAGDEPVDAGEVEAFERTEQRLGADEAHSRRYFAQMVGTLDEATVLDRDAHPYVGRPGKPGASAARRSWRLVRT